MNKYKEIKRNKNYFFQKDLNSSKEPLYSSSKYYKKKKNFISKTK